MPARLTADSLFERRDLPVDLGGWGGAVFDAFDGSAFFVFDSDDGSRRVGLHSQSSFQAIVTSIKFTPGLEG